MKLSGSEPVTSAEISDAGNSSWPSPAALSADGDDGMACLSAWRREGMRGQGCEVRRDGKVCGGMRVTVKRVTAIRIGRAPNLRFPAGEIIRVLVLLSSPEDTHSHVGTGKGEPRGPGGGP